MATVSMNDIDECGVGPRQVTLLPGVHVQRISRVQSGDSAYLKAPQRTATRSTYTVYRSRRYRAPRR